MLPRKDYAGNDLLSYQILFHHIYLRQGLMFYKIASNYLCIQEWAWISNPTATTTLVLGLQLWTPTPGFGGLGNKTQDSMPAKQVQQTGFSSQFDHGFGGILGHIIHSLTFIF